MSLSITPPKESGILQGSNGQRAFFNPATNAETNKDEALLGFQQKKQERYSEIYTHELAHQSTGGSLAGGIVMEMDNNGVAVGGHVPIKMALFSKANPEESLNKARIAYNAALAPADPSSQDKAVASMASNVMSQSIFAMGQKHSKPTPKDPNAKVGNAVDISA